MPTPTYTPLATVTLAGTASSVTFSSIPATYRDLVFVWEGTNTGGGPALRFNGDTGSNYPYVIMKGPVFSEAGTLSFALVYYAAYTSGNRGMATCQIMDYSATDKHKTVLVRHDGNNVNEVNANADRWANTAAITSITVVNPSANFSSGSTFNLYGIEA
jgi:hypothetical protein